MHPPLSPILTCQCCPFPHKTLFSTFLFFLSRLSLFFDNATVFAITLYTFDPRITLPHQYRSPLHIYDLWHHTKHLKPNCLFAVYFYLGFKAKHFFNCPADSL